MPVKYQNQSTGGGGGGTITGGGAATQVAFWTGATSIGSDPNFFWDDVNKRQGIGTLTPQAFLDIFATNNAEFIRLSTLGDSVGIYTGTADPNITPVTAEAGSLFLRTNGAAYINTNGLTTWLDFTSGNGDVFGPGSSTDNHLARFDGITGKLIQNSVVNLTDLGSMSGITSLFADSLALTIPLAPDSGGTGNLMTTFINGRILIQNSVSLSLDLGFIGAGTNIVVTNGPGTISIATAATVMNGPGLSTDNAVVRWDGITGTLTQNSVVLIGDTGAVTGVLSILAAAGTAAAPTYSFTLDTDTGMFRTAANGLGFATSGTLRFDINTLDIVSTLKIRGPFEGAVEPTYSFSGDVDTGMYHSATNALGFSAGGINRLDISATLNQSNQPFEIVYTHTMTIPSVAAQQGYYIPVGDYFLNAAGETTLEIDTGSGFVFQTYITQYNHLGRATAPGTVMDAVIGFTIVAAVAAGWTLRFTWKQRVIPVTPLGITKVLTPPNYAIQWGSNSGSAPNGITVPEMPGYVVEFWRQTWNAGGFMAPSASHREGRRYLPYFRGGAGVFTFASSAFCAARLLKRNRYRVCYYNTTTGARSNLSTDKIVVCSVTSPDAVNGRSPVRTTGSVWIE